MYHEHKFKILIFEKLGLKYPTSKTYQKRSLLVMPSTRYPYEFIWKITRLSYGVYILILHIKRFLCFCERVSTRARFEDGN